MPLLSLLFHYFVKNINLNHMHISVSFILCVAIKSAQNVWAENRFICLKFSRQSNGYLYVFRGARVRRKCVNYTQKHYLLVEILFARLFLKYFYYSHKHQWISIAFHAKINSIFTYFPRVKVAPMIQRNWIAIWAQTHFIKIHNNHINDISVMVYVI